MKKALMLSAMALVLGATTAQAKKIGKSYTFGTSGGGLYCDGITNIVLKHGILTAVHNVTGCGLPASDNSLLGGYESTISSLGSGIWFELLASTPPAYGSPYFTMAYSVNFGALSFDAAYESEEYGYPFYQYLTGGKLFPGYNGAKTASSKGSTLATALKSAKLLRR